MDLLRVALIFIFALCWLYWLWSRRHLYKCALQFPCSWGLPFIGSIWRVGTPTNFIPFLSQQIKIYKYRTVCFWFSLYPVIFTVDPKVIEQIFSSQDFVEKAEIFYKPVRESVHGGVVALHEKNWRFSRKLVAPIMRHKNLINLLPCFNKIIKEFLTVMEDICVKGEPRKILHDAQYYFLRIGMEGNLGYDEDKNDNGKFYRDYADSLYYMFHFVSYESFLNFLNLRWLIQYHPTFLKHKNRIIRSSEEIISYCTKKFEKEKKEQSNLENKDEDLNSNRLYKFIESAAHQHNIGQLSWEDFVGDIIGLQVGTFETLSSLTSFAMLLFGTHPEIQERCYEEIKSVFPTKDFNVKFEDFDNLPYIEMVIQELVRLYPAVPILGRNFQQDTIIEVEGRKIFIPKDMQILTCLYQLHRVPRVWGAEPDKFNPDNFLPHKIAERKPYEYMPYSIGPRNCVGWRFGLFVLRVAIPQILRNYRVTTDFKYENFQVKNTMFLGNKNEPKLMFHRRE